MVLWWWGVAFIHHSTVLVERWWGGEVRVVGELVRVASKGRG